MNEKELEKNMLELVSKGMFEIINFKDIKFKLTDFGKAEAKTLIKIYPEYKTFWDELTNNLEVK